MVIANLKDDPTSAIKGVLWSTRGPWLTFKDCTLLRAGEQTPIDGEVVVHREKVTFLQVIPQ